MKNVNKCANVLRVSDLRGQDELKQRVLSYRRSWENEENFAKKRVLISPVVLKNS